MTDEQFKDFEAFIAALIDEKIQEAFGRDSMHESWLLSERRIQLRVSLGLSEY